jgi:hypothetical protein
MVPRRGVPRLDRRRRDRARQGQLVVTNGAVAQDGRRQHHR